MSYNNINHSGNWKDASDSLNYNFNKIFSQITELQEKLIKAKGLFRTVEELKEKFPNPTEGDWAIVGNTIPGEIYVADENGQWIDTGETGGGVNVELTDYLQSEFLDNVISILDQNEEPLTITASVSPELDEFTGEDKNINISWNIRRGDTVVQDLYFLTINIDGTIVETSQLPIGTFLTKINKLGNTNIELTASTLESVEKDNLNYYQVLPIYIGTSLENAASKINPTDLEKQDIKLNPKGEYILRNNATPDQYLWVCIPGNLENSNITEVKLADEETITNLESPVIGGLGTYKIYRSTDTIGVTKDTGLKVII